MLTFIQGDYVSLEGPQLPESTMGAYGPSCYCATEELIPDYPEPD